MDKLYVVTAISNPVRYASRYKLYEQFAKHMQDSGVELYTIEMAFGTRPFAITDSSNPRHIQVRSSSELWHKENLLNVAISRLPIDWKYVAWVDADVAFTRSDWASETVHSLQHYKVVQLFSHAQDLGPDYQPMMTHTGFIYNYLNFGLTKEWIGPCPDESVSNVGGHPGYAWAATRDAFDHLGGLIDYAILGAADRHMACALVNRVEDSFFHSSEPEGEMTEAYKSLLYQWQDRAARYVDGNIGYVKGTLYHYWHGSKRSRGYENRWKILRDNQFDPIKDLKKDSQGLLMFGSDKPLLRDQIRAYFRSRNEDSIDL